MQYIVETADGGRGVCLRGHKEHITLRASDLRDSVSWDTTEEGFISHVSSWLWDIIGDEYGHENVKYSHSDLKRVLGGVYVNLMKDFLASHSEAEKQQWEAERDRRTAEKERDDSLVKRISSLCEKSFHSVYMHAWNTSPYHKGLWGAIEKAREDPDRYLAMTDSELLDAIRGPFKEAESRARGW